MRWQPWCVKTGAAVPVSPALRAMLPFLALLMLCGIVLTACSEELGAIESPVPARHVSYECYVGSINEQMGQTQQPSLECNGGYVHIDQWRTQASYLGVGGLLLCHDNFTYNTFYAYDLACPYCYPHGATIRLKDGMTATCAECGSAFGAVMWGSPAPTAGPANKEGYPLRTYHARLNPANNRLSVTN